MKDYSIPDLKFNVVFVNFEHLGPKFHSDGDFVFPSIAFVSKLQQEAGLSNSGVPNDYVLEEEGIGYDINSSNPGVDSQYSKSPISV